MHLKATALKLSPDFSQNESMSKYWVLISLPLLIWCIYCSSYKVHGYVKYNCSFFKAMFIQEALSSAAHPSALYLASRTVVQCQTGPAIAVPKNRFKDECVDYFDT